MRSQIACVLHFIQIQPFGRELGDPVAIFGPDFHIEYLGPDHAANCAFIHGKRPSCIQSQPLWSWLPSIRTMTSILADTNRTDRVGPSNPDSRDILEGRASYRDPGVKVGVLVFAVDACQFDSRLEVRISLR